MRSHMICKQWIFQMYVSLLEGNYGRYIELDKRVNLNQQTFHWQALFNRCQSTNVMNSCEIRMFDLGNLMSDVVSFPFCWLTHHLG